MSARSSGRTPPIATFEPDKNKNVETVKIERMRHDRAFHKQKTWPNLSRIKTGCESVFKASRMIDHIDLKTVSVRIAGIMKTTHRRATKALKPREQGILAAIANCNHIPHRHRLRLRGLLHAPHKHAECTQTILDRARNS